MPALHRDGARWLCKPRITTSRGRLIWRRDDWSLAPFALLQTGLISRKHVVAHECVLLRQLLSQKMGVKHVVRVSLGEILPWIQVRVRRHAAGARGNLRHPPLLHAAGDDEEKHEMTDLVMKHLEKYPGAVQAVNENAPLP